MKRTDVSVAYGISDTPFYWEMLSRSVASLRVHEPDIPIMVFAFGKIPRGARRWIKALNVQLLPQTPVKEGDGWLLKWIALGQVKTQTVLLLDVDTFVQRPLAAFFKRYSKAHVYARKELGMDTIDWQGPIKVPRRLDEENFAKAARGIGAKILPVFNSGVMIWNHGTHQNFLERLPSFLKMVNLVRTQRGAARIVSRSFFADEIAGSLALGTLRAVTTGFLTPVDAPFYTETRFSNKVDRGFITHINTVYYVDWASDQKSPAREITVLKKSMRRSKIKPVDWPSLIRGDSQFPSASILAARIEPLFKTKPWIIDPIFEFRPTTPGRRCDVALLGNFLLELSQISHWPQKDFHFWVLAASVKRVLVDVFGMNPKTISVINRYKLFPARSARALPHLSKRLDFVYGGRLSETKNIFLMAEVISVLQCERGLDAHLSLYGNFDGHRSEDVGLAEIEKDAFEAKFHRFVKSLNWKRKPSLHHDLKPGEWLKQTSVNSIGISLSTHMKEDYGVALAEEQQRGFPLVVSAWGAHLDLKDSLQIPLHLISHPCAPARVRSRSARAIAAYLIDHWHLAKAGPLDKTAQKSKRVSHAELLALQTKIARKYPSFFKIDVQEDFFNYLKTAEGQRLMRSYRKAFAKSSGDFLR